MNAEGELQLTAELAEALRHRQLVWARIPPRSRKLLLPFLTVQETLRLDTAVAPGQEKERDHLEKAYRGLRSGGFDEYVFSDENDYEGIRWARKRGIDLWHLKLEYWGEKDADKVLGLLVVDEKKEMATYYAERSDAEDTEVDDRNGRPSSTLLEASRRGYLEVVRSLIGRGVDVNRSDDQGKTPLYSASYWGHLEVVRALLAAGADVNKSDNDGVTPLYETSRGGYLDVVRALLAAGADVNRSSNSGDTPLYWASLYGHLEVVRALLAAGADVNRSDNDGGTPLSVALRNNDTQVADLLRDAGAH